MKRIITIGREFGSGGRELGRRLAEELGMRYCDQEILEELVRRTSFDASYIREAEECLTRGFQPITVGRTLLRAEDHSFQQAQQIYREQSRVLRELAEGGDCVIVGRCGDYVLRDLQPLRIFVYAGLESRLRRCRARMSGQEGWTDEELRRQIRRIDRRRARYYAFHTEQTWGDKKNYDLCLNTGGRELRELARACAGLLRGGDGTG